nr:TolC family protein [Vibrio sp. Of7-15]
MRKIKHSMVTVLVCGLFSSPLIQAETVEFKQAWDRVLVNSDELAAQKANINRSEHLQDAARDLYLPSIGLSAMYTRLDDDVTLSASEFADSTPIGGEMLKGLDHLLTSTITDRNIFTTSIRAIWPIFTGGRISAAQDIAEGKKEEAESLLGMKQQAKFEDLAKYYFSVVLAKDVFATYQEVEDGLQKHRDFALRLEEQGQIAKVERLQAEASLDKAKVDRKKAQRDLEIAQVALTKLIKAEGGVLPSTPLFINHSLPEMQAFIDKTLSTYPGLAMLDAKHKQASNLIKAEKGKYYPEVYLYGNYNLHEDDSLASAVAPDWMVGVGVNVPLVDTSGRSGKVKAAHSAVLQVNHLRAQAEQDLTVLVEKTYREANQAIEEYQGLSSSLALASENVRLREKAFRQGLSTSLDVVDAELYLASVKTQRLAASFNYVISLSKLLAISNEMNSFSQYQYDAQVKVKS